MRIQVAELRRSPSGRMTVLLQGEMPPIDCGGRELQPEGLITGEADLELVGKRILAHVRARVKGWASCDRCLEPVVVEVGCEFDQEFVPYETGQQHDQVPAGGRDRSVISGDEIDLTEGLRQSVILSLPSKLLCRGNCRGLCPRCGRDLNKGDCDCGGEEIDPRFETLRPLLARLKPEQGGPLN